MRESSSGKEAFFGAGSDLALAVLKVQFWVDNKEIRDYFTGHLVPRAYRTHLMH